jgi:hypothetical protein
MANVISYKLGLGFRVHGSICGTRRVYAISSSATLFPDTEMIAAYQKPGLNPKPTWRVYAISSSATLFSDAETDR